MTFGFKSTHRLFDKTSWIVKYPIYARGLNPLIVQAQFVIKNAYIVGVLVSLVTALTLAIHKPVMLGNLGLFIPIILKPFIYAVLFVEFLFRPYKNKLEKMLKNQRSQKVLGESENN